MSGILTASSVSFVRFTAWQHPARSTLPSAEWKAGKGGKGLVKFSVLGAEREILFSGAGMVGDGIYVDQMVADSR